MSPWTILVWARCLVFQHENNVWRIPTDQILAIRADLKRVPEVMEHLERGDVVIELPTRSVVLFSGTANGAEAVHAEILTALARTFHWTLGPRDGQQS